MAQTNPYNNIKQQVEVNGKKYNFFNLYELKDQRLNKLPYSIRILLECAIRNCDEFNVKKVDVENILNWKENMLKGVDIPFKPARVILQDFTGVPLIVDLAAMREAVVKLGGDPKKINPACQVDLVIDHSVQAQYAKNQDSLKKNEELELSRNLERFQFLKWGQNAFQNLNIVPPGSGIVHQVNLEYLAPVLYEKDEFLFPDSVVGTDSHTTMINGLGVLGWGVGGIEAEAVMLGECMSMVLPEVVGVCLSGTLSEVANATDLTLRITERLRQVGVVSKFVEFYGPGVQSLSLTDRATIANMAPEYGATTGFFPIDEQTLKYMRVTGRSEELISKTKAYLLKQGLFKLYTENENQVEYTTNIEIDLSTIQPSLAGPKRPMDRIDFNKLHTEFKENLCKPVTFKSFNAKDPNLAVDIQVDGEKYTFKHGNIVIAAITSCTNTSNPDVMIAAGILCRNAVQKGLKVPKYIKTTLAPGSQVVTQYYRKAGLEQYMDQLGFNTAAYGCTTCIGNSGDIDPVISEVIAKNNLVASAVLSGNRNFEGRVHPQTAANYLASPPLVIAYALAGNVNFDFETQPLGQFEGKDIFLRDIYPSKAEIQKILDTCITKDMFIDNYAKISKGTETWNSIKVQEGTLYPWDNKSTYIHLPPYFDGLQIEPAPIKPVSDAHLLCLFGDSITTDHISPAGNIPKNSPAGRWLAERGVPQQDFNVYGTRRGNDEIMARGTFANVKLINKLVEKVGFQTKFIPENKTYDIFDAAMEYKKKGIQLGLVGGKEYGTGSSRDWAAKGPFLQGVRFVIAESYERIHRSNLIGMGILPCQFQKGQSAQTLGLSGLEQFTIETDIQNLKVNQLVKVKTNTDVSFEVVCRLDTVVEVVYYQHGGILNFVLRKLITQ